MPRTTTYEADNKNRVTQTRKAIEKARSNVRGLKKSIKSLRIQRTHTHKRLATEIIHSIEYALIMNNGMR